MILEKFQTDKYDNELVFINPDITLGELKQYISYQCKEFEKSEIKNIILFGSDYFNFAINFFAAAFTSKQIYLISDKERLKLLNVDYLIPDNAKKLNEKININNIQPKDILINFFTSGSTGEPQNIQKNLYNLEVEARTTIEEFNLKSDRIFVATTSWAHSFGIVFDFILPFGYGCRINKKRIDFPEQLDFEDKYILISTPSFMEKLAKYDYTFYKSPEKIFLAGAKLKPEIIDYFKQYTDLIDIYGSTETGNIAYKRGYTNFTPFKDVEVTTDNKSQAIIKSEYFPQEQALLSDIIEFVNDKEFVFKKRSDRIVKVFEKRISLDEIETNLKKHNKVKDCYCFMYNDKLACIVSTDDISLEKADLKHFLTNYGEVVPKKWRLVDELPKTATGKIDRSKLLKLFGMNQSLPFVISKTIEHNEANITLIFKRSSNFFNGHFDMMSILPGVVQLYYAKFFADNIFNIEIPPKEVKRVKFSNIIRPDTPVTLTLKNNENSVEFAYMTDAKTYSSGIFVK